jgi:hypothetical protein
MGHFCTKDSADDGIEARTPNNHRPHCREPELHTAFLKHPGCNIYMPAPVGKTKPSETTLSHSLGKMFMLKTII